MQHSFSIFHVINVFVTCEWPRAYVIQLTKAVSSCFCDYVITENFYKSPIKLWHFSQVPCLYDNNCDNYSIHFNFIIHKLITSFLLITLHREYWLNDIIIGERFVADVPKGITIDSGNSIPKWWNWDPVVKYDLWYVLHTAHVQL